MAPERSRRSRCSQHSPSPRTVQPLAMGLSIANQDRLDAPRSMFHAPVRAPRLRWATIVSESFGVTLILVLWYLIVDEFMTRPPAWLVGGVELEAPAPTQAQTPAQAVAEAPPYPPTITVWRSNDRTGGPRLEELPYRPHLDDDVTPIRERSNLDWCQPWARPTHEQQQLSAVNTTATPAAPPPPTPTTARKLRRGRSKPAADDSGAGGAATRTTSSAGATATARDVERTTTVIIATMGRLRRHDLLICVRSIRALYPNIAILVGDGGFGALHVDRTRARSHAKAKPATTRPATRANYTSSPNATGAGAGAGAADAQAAVASPTGENKESGWEGGRQTDAKADAERERAAAVELQQELQREREEEKEAEARLERELAREVTEVYQFKSYRGRAVMTGTVRNVLISVATTPYVLVVDDDFVFTRISKVENLLTTMLQADVDLVAGTVVDRRCDPKQAPKHRKHDGRTCNAQPSVFAPISAATATALGSPEGRWGVCPHAADKGFDLRSDQNPRCYRTSWVRQFFLASTGAMQGSGWDDDVGWLDHFGESQSRPDSGSVQPATTQTYLY